MSLSQAFIPFSYVVLSSPPQNLTGVAIDPHTIQVTWSPPNNVSQLENATNYYIFYRQKNGIIGQWESRGIPLTNNSSFNITRLKPRTWYKIRITVSVLDGNGPASEEISIQTLEGGIVYLFLFKFRIYNLTFICLCFGGFRQNLFKTFASILMIRGHSKGGAHN